MAKNGEFTASEKSMLQQAVLNFIATLEGLQLKLEKEKQSAAAKIVATSIGALKDLETKLL